METLFMLLPGSLKLKSSDNDLLVALRKKGMTFPP